MTLIISDSNSKDELFNLGALAIARILDSTLFEFSFDQDPHALIADLERKKTLAQLSGDAAMMHPSGTSWLEAASSWKHPLILLTSPSIDGDIPGSTAALVCLCKSFSIPVIGIMQLGGDWDIRQRKLDGLPWCGCIPNELLDKNLTWKNISFDSLFFIEDMKIILKKRISQLGLKTYFQQLFK